MTNEQQTALRNLSLAISASGGTTETKELGDRNGSPIYVTCHFPKELVQHGVLILADGSTY